jgi:CheY-like chemotaxis protein
MPGMDGIEATGIIREINTDYARNIPIIALTANAIAGNEEMFLSKGFQAFLSKPIDIGRLDEVIRRWVRDAKQEALLAEQQEIQLQYWQDRRSVMDRRSGIDRRKSGLQFAGLDMKKGIERFGGDEETYFSILRSYAVNTRPLLESIERVREDNLAGYAVVVHGIKGSSNGIFAEMIGASAENLEKAAIAGDYDYISAHHETFLNAAWKLIHDLEDVLSDMDAGNPKPIKDKPDAETLSKLLAACKAYDVDGVDEAVAELEKYGYESDDGLAAWLIENSKLTNFRQIMEKLSDLTNADGGYKNGE